jgi:phosphoglycolate phosphatase-like HAD superfamily hydrolase
MTVKVIIFDFDGTIADTLDAIVSITNRLALEFGYKQTTLEELAQLKNLNSRQIIDQSGISIFKLPFLIRKVKVELSKEIQRLSPIPGIKEALTDLKNQGNSLGIITSNSKDNVMAFLGTNNLQELFNFIYSGTTFGKSKVINKLLKQENINPEEVIYVGDETRDIEAARKSNIKAIAVTWGFNSKQVLAEQSPDFLIHQPNDLIEVIGSLQQAGTPRW